MDQQELNKAVNSALRDSFAMAALNGLLASTNPRDGAVSTLAKRYADIAYKFADAMIEQRQKAGK